jgi:tetratricopeptide (TPR) repeat protein
VATALDNLGTLHRLAGKRTEAEAELRQAARIWERLGHPNQAVSLSSLAGLLIDQRRLAEAESVLETARDVALERFGASHPATASAWQYLGIVYREQGRVDDAEAVFRRCVAAYEASYGPEHLAVAAALDEWAATLERAGRPHEAALLLERARGIRARAARVNPPG